MLSLPWPNFRSLTKAAAHLGISAPSASQAVSALEAKLGVHLLNRTTTSVALTKAGERLIADLSGEGMHQEDTMTELANQQILQQQQTLLREINHRINNEFAAAIGSISATAARSGNQSVKAALSAVMDLLHRYADVHRALQMPEDDTPIDAAAYLRQLCLSISRAQLDARKIKLVLSVQSLQLQAERCWRLGLIVHELINNAARHAFVGGSGEIRVTVWRNDAFVRCSVQDNGTAAVDIQPGRGLKIVHDLSKGLGGRCRQTFGPQGSRSLLVFPDSDGATVIPRAMAGRS
jgi:two-component sensor histidine kinase